MKLDTSSMSNAIESLALTVKLAKQSPSDDIVRDALIQRFEYSYELSCKMLKRQLEQMADVPSSIDKLSFNEMIREACEKGLIDNFDDWLIFRRQRNITSHTYNKKKAISVSHTAVDFLAAAQKLLHELVKRNHD